MYLEEKEYNNALDEFNFILNSIPDSPVANYYCGITYIEMGEYEKGREYLFKIKPESELYIESIIRISFSYKQEKKLDAGIDYIMGKMKEGTRSPELFRFTVALLQEAKRYDDAIRIANEGISNFSQSIELYYQLAFVYDEIGNIDNAIEQMKKILEIKPDHPDALNYIGYTWAEKGINLDEAENMIKKALQTKPNDGFIMDSLAWVHYQKGLYELALQEVKKALHLAGDDPIILEHLGDIYLKLNKRMLALDAYNKSLQQEMKDRDKERIKKKYEELKLLLR
jgi:tetratricopeptide (TPR) repeat protein